VDDGRRPGTESGIACRWMVTMETP
jgi:hypothetical protein